MKSTDILVRHVGIQKLTSKEEEFLELNRDLQIN